MFKPPRAGGLVGVWLKGSRSRGLLCVERTCRVGAAGAVVAGRHGVYFSFVDEKIHEIRGSGWPGEHLERCAARRSTVSLWVSVPALSGPEMTSALSSTVKASVSERGDLWGRGSRLRWVVAALPKAVALARCTREEICRFRDPVLHLPRWEAAGVGEGCCA